MLDPTTIDVPDPPNLPAVPDFETCPEWDEKNPACRNDPRFMCSHGAYCKCPSPPDVENPACWAVMPCPTTPDRRVRACNPHNDAHLNVVIARIIRVEVGTGVIVTVSAGSEHGVGKTDRASVVRNDTGDVLGPATIIRVDKRTTALRVSLTADEVKANPFVRFDP